MSAAGVLDQLSPATLCSSLGVDGADVWAEAGGGLSVPARGLGTSERIVQRGCSQRPELISVVCISSLSLYPVPPPCLALLWLLPVVAASGQVGCVPWQRAGILLGRGRR